VNLWRVLWIDSNGDGRFSTVKAATKEAAAWEVCRNENDPSNMLEAVQAIDQEKQ